MADTIVTIGSGGGYDFSALDAADAACPHTDLVAAGTNWVMQLAPEMFYGGGPYATIRAVNADAQHRKIICPMPGGAWYDNPNVSTTRLDYDTNGGAALQNTAEFQFGTLDIQCPHTEVIGLKFANGPSAGSVILVNANNVTLRSNIVVSYDGAAIRIAYVSGTRLVENFLVHRGNKTNGGSVYAVGGGDYLFESNTFLRTTGNSAANEPLYAEGVSGSQFTFRNNIVAGSYIYGFIGNDSMEAASADYNVYTLPSSATAPHGAHDQYDVDISSLFSGHGDTDTDLRTKATSSAVSAGFGPSAYSGTKDGANRTRPYDDWTAGAWEAGDPGAQPITFNGGGTMPEPESSTPLAAPAAPTNTGETNVTQTGATLNWTLGTGGGALDAVKVRYRVVGAQNWTTVTLAASATSHALTGLSAGTAYEWAPGGSNATADTFASADTFTTIAAPPAPTPTVTGVTFSPASPQTIANGATLQVTPTVNGANSPDQGGAWSKQSGVGSVTQTGNVATIAGGTTAGQGVYRFTPTADASQFFDFTVTVQAAAQAGTRTATITGLTRTPIGSNVAVPAANLTGIRCAITDPTWPAAGTQVYATITIATDAQGNATLTGLPAGVPASAGAFLRTADGSYAAFLPITTAAA